MIETRALVLKRFDFSETSQVGHLFTRSHGRVAALAKGIKRPGPELRGPLDLFSLADVTLLPRRGDLMVLTRYRVIDGFRALRRRARTLNAAFYVTELLHEGTRDLVPHEALFDAAAGTLALLAGEAEPDWMALVLHFELCYLREAGFLPDFTACTSCGRRAPDAGPVRFAHARDGLVCRRCAPAERVALVTVDGPTRAARAPLLGAPSPAEAAATQPSAAAVRSLRPLLDAVLRRVLEKDLRSLPFLAP